MSTFVGALAVAGILCFSTHALAQGVPLDWTLAEQQFTKGCVICHGEGAKGTERGPSLVMSRSLQNRSEKEIQEVIRNGTEGGMPPFALPEAQSQALAQWIRFLNAPVFEFPTVGDMKQGERFFFEKGDCATCHMVAGRGKANGPDLSAIARQLTLQDLEQSLDHPGTKTESTSTCPSFAWCPQDQ